MMLGSELMMNLGNPVAAEVAMQQVRQQLVDSTKKRGKPTVTTNPNGFSGASSSK